MTRHEDSYVELDASVGAVNLTGQRLHEARWNGLPLPQVRLLFQSAERALDEALALALARPVGRQSLIGALREHREELVLTAHGTVGMFVPETAHPRSLAASGPLGLVGDAEPLADGNELHGLDLQD